MQLLLFIYTILTVNGQVGVRDCPAPLLNGEVSDSHYIPFDANLLPVSNSSSCTFKCSGTMSTDDDLIHFTQSTRIISGIGLVCVLFVFLTWGMFPAKARQKMTFWCSFCSTLASSFVFFPSIRHQNVSEVWCKDEKEPYKQGDGLSMCLFQSLALIFSALSLCGWWWCSCFDLFTKFYRKKRNIEHYLFYYHVFSWSVSISCVLMFVLTNSIGYEQPRLWCFLSIEANDTLEYVFFYGVVSIQWFTGTIMFILTLASLISKLRNADTEADKKRYWEALALYKVPLFFLFEFSIFWAVLFQFVFWTDIRRDELSKAAYSWFTCLIISTDLGYSNPISNASDTGLSYLTTISQDQQGCGPIQPDGLSKQFLTLTLLCIAGNGMILFIAFGLQKENFVLWLNFIKSFRNKEEQLERRKVGEPNLSTFKELRITLAKWNIYLCEQFAGLETENRRPRKRLSKVQKAQEILDAIDILEENQQQNEINHFLQDNDVNSSTKQQSGDKSKFMDDPLWGVKFEQDDDDVEF